MRGSRRFLKDCKGRNDCTPRPGVDVITSMTGNVEEIPNLGFRTIHASVVSKKVLGELKSKEVRGTVTGIYDHSVNIETEDRFLINLGINRLVITPRSILIAEEDFSRYLNLKISLGAHISMFQDAIYIPSIKLRIFTEKARKYDPKCKVSGVLLAKDKIERNLTAALIYVETEGGERRMRSYFPLAGYFLERYSFIRRLNRGESKAILLSSHFRQETSFFDFKKVLWNKIDSLMESVGNYDGRRIQEGIRNLIGLGPGLTPSGDDFLSGFVSAGMILGNRREEQRQFIKRIGWMLVKESRDRTNTISRSMFEDASNGEISEPATRMIESTVLTEDIETIRQSAKSLSSIGACSGEDLLNGMAVGIFMSIRDCSKYDSNS